MPQRTTKPVLHRFGAIVAVGVALALGSASAPAADVPNLATGRFVIYLGQLGSGRGCLIDRRLAAQLRAEVRRVPIGRVLVAPTCAARATARRVFGRARLSRLPAGRGLDRVIGSRPRRGTNTVIVGPAGTVARARGLAFARGEAWVLDRGDPVLRLRPHGWRSFLGTRAPARFREWSVTSATQVHPHDIWPAGDGTVWYTAQFRGAAGRLDTATGARREIPLGSGSSPHGVIADEAGNAWITDQGLDAIVRVDRTTEAVTVYPIPAPDSNPNTAAFDRRGMLWFTGAGGYYGRVDPATGRVDAWPAARGGGIGTTSGPYGITVTPDGVVWFVSLRGGYLGRVDPATGVLTVIDPPTRNSGTRRVWSDSRGRLWVTESFASKLAMYDPASGRWREWRMPGVGPGDRTGHPYAVCVDSADRVWLTDFSTNTLQRFDPTTERFQAYRMPTTDALVRQIVEVGGVIWGAESATEKLVAFSST
jgi:virginiamycin B lyase